MDNTDQLQVDDAYRAIGRYTVAFSQLIAEMRDLIATRLSGSEFHLAQLVLGEAMHMSIAHAFFGLARKVGNFSTPEIDVAATLEIAVGKTITERTHFAHGDWLVGYYTVTEPIKIATPRRVRILPHHKGGPYKIDDLTPSQIDEKTDALLALLTEVYEFGRIAFGLPVTVVDPETGGGKNALVRVSDVFVVEDPGKRSGQPKRVARTGPRAGDIAWMVYDG